MTNWKLLLLLEPYFGDRSAAVAQFGALVLYAGLLLALVMYLFKEKIEKKAVKLIKICGSLAGLFVLYFFARYFLIHAGFN